MAKDKAIIPTPGVVPTSVRLKTEAYEQVKQYADENGTSFSEALNSVLNDAIAFFEPKLNALKLLVEQSTKKIEELKAQEIAQTKLLNEIKGQLEETEYKHEATKTNFLELFLTIQQINALEEIRYYRLQKGYNKDDEGAANPVEFLYVSMKRDIIEGRNTKPRLAYKDIFPDLSTQANMFPVAYDLNDTEAD